MRAKRIRTEGRGLWRSLLAQCPDASFFLTPEWAEIAERSLGTPTVCLAFEFDDGARAVLPALARSAGWLRRDLESPGAGLPGGFLCEGPSSAARTGALLRVLGHMPNAVVRLGFEPRTAPEPGVAAAWGGRVEPYHWIDLSAGAEPARAAFSESFRARCREAEHSGVRVRFETGRTGFVEFGHLLRRSALAADPAARRPLAFFATCADVARRAAAALHLVLARSARSGDAAVAGLLVARRGDALACWMAAVDAEAGGPAAEAAVFRTVVEWAGAEGAKRLLLGPAGTGPVPSHVARGLGAEAHLCVASLEVRGSARRLLRRTRSADAAAPAAPRG